ncbi:MAG: M24 family metallopeptidase [Acidimicrobiales bacterium]
MTLPRDRLDRLRNTMGRLGVEWVLTADPINITYATGVRNMNVFSMMGPARLLLVGVEDTVVAWEFAGSEHLSQSSPLVDEVRTAPGLTALSGSRHTDAIDVFSTQIASLIGARPETRSSLAVERVDHDVTDALRSAGCSLSSATEVFVESRRIKLPDEIEVMDEAMSRVEAAVSMMLEQLRAGATEIEVWSHFQQHLIANGGEYVSTRLVQAGPRTFPYFQEAGSTVIADGDLFCVDTDAIGFGGYAVDFSRTYHVGPSEPSSDQRHLHALALDQLEHNASLIAPGVRFEEFARGAWDVPARHRAFGYSSLAHGLGMCGEFPYVPVAVPDQAFPVDGEFEPNMVVCVESYIGDPERGEGVKLEDQYLVTDSGVRRMSSLPFDHRLSV